MGKVKTHYAIDKKGKSWEVKIWKSTKKYAATPQMLIRGKQFRKKSNATKFVKSYVRKSR